MIDLVHVHKEPEAVKFLYALLRGMTVGDCLHYGNAAAAIVVSRLSCSEAMPTLAEVERLIEEQKARVAPTAR